MARLSHETWEDRRTCLRVFHCPTPFLPDHLWLVSARYLHPLRRASDIKILVGGQINYWHTFPLTAKKARVLATIIAELEDNPAPGGTVPVTSKSTGTGRVVFSFEGEK